MLFSWAHLSHSGVISFVGIQFVLNQLGQGGVVLVLTDRWVGRKHFEGDKEWRQVEYGRHKKKCMQIYTYNHNFFSVREGVEIILELHLMIFLKIGL